MLTAIFKRPGEGGIQSLKNLGAWGYIEESGTQQMSIIKHIVLTGPFIWGIIKTISVWNTASLGNFCLPRVFWSLGKPQSGETEKCHRAKAT